MPLSQVDAKHFRWHAEVTSGGRLLIYQAGKGIAHRGPDSLSRNPEQRDLFIFREQEDGINGDL